MKKSCFSTFFTMFFHEQVIINLLQTHDKPVVNHIKDLIYNYINLEIGRGLITEIWSLIGLSSLIASVVAVVLGICRDYYIEKSRFKRQSRTKSFNNKLKHTHRLIMYQVVYLQPQSIQEKKWQVHLLKTFQNLIDILTLSDCLSFCYQKKLTKKEIKLTL